MWQLSQQKKFILKFIANQPYTYSGLKYAIYTDNNGREAGGNR